VARRNTALFLAAAVLALVTGCASTPRSGPAVNPNATEANPPGDIPDDQVFVTFTPPSGGYTIGVPEGWARTESGGAVSFTDKLNTVRVETVPAPTPATVERARAGEVPAIQASSSHFTLGDVTTVQRKAGEAVLVTYNADGPKDQVTGKVVANAVERYEFWRDGTEVVITLSGPVGADNVDPWRTVTDSFGWS